MAERSKIQIPKRFIDKYGKNIILWSYSKINTYHNCTHEYYLSKIKHVKSRDNIYTLCGTYAHDILEKFEKREMKQTALADKFDSDLFDLNMSTDYKFSSDEGKNEKMNEKYRYCVVDFFKHHQHMADKVATEKVIWIDVDGHLFMGYVDAIHKDKDGNFIITDYKTSTMYKGKQVDEHGKQLLLYALGLVQGGVPISKIKVRWIFMKYVNVSYKLKNGKTKTVSEFRNQWVKKIKSPLKKDLTESGLNEIDAELKVETCIKKNSISDLPKEIQDKYTLSECYVYPTLETRALSELKIEMRKDIQDIFDRETDEENWERDKIQQSESYYCSVLCGVHDQCKYYHQYLVDNGLIKQNKENNLINELNKIDEELNLPF